jgi:hypothetical protein
MYERVLACGSTAGQRFEPPMDGEKTGLSFAFVTATLLRFEFPGIGSIGESGWGFVRSIFPGKVQVKSTYTHTRENKEENGSLRGQDVRKNVAGGGRPERKVAHRIAAKSIES